MTVVDEDITPISGVPHLYRLIKARRGDACATVRPGHRSHGIDMTVVGVDVAAISGVPDLHCAVPRARGDARATR